MLIQPNRLHQHFRRTDCQSILQCCDGPFPKSCIQLIFIQQRNSAIRKQYHIEIQIRKPRIFTVNFILQRKIKIILDNLTSPVKHHRQPPIFILRSNLQP